MKAIHNLNGRPFKGRDIRISLAVDQRIYLQNKIDQANEAGQEKPETGLDIETQEIQKPDENATEIKEAVPAQKVPRKKTQITSEAPQADNQASEKDFSVATHKHEKTPEERLQELQATVFVQNLDFDLTEQDRKSTRLNSSHG